MRCGVLTLDPHINIRQTRMVASTCKSINSFVATTEKPEISQIFIIRLPFLRM